MYYVMLYLIHYVESCAGDIWRESLVGKYIRESKEGGCSDKWECRLRRLNPA